MRNDCTRQHTDIFKVCCCQSLVVISADKFDEVLLSFFCWLVLPRKFFSRWTFFVISWCSWASHGAHVSCLNWIWQNALPFVSLVFRLSSSKKVVPIWDLDMSKFVSLESPTGLLWNLKFFWWNNQIKQIV